MNDKYIAITNEDNIELMSRYKDKYFELAFIDPPYGIGATKMSMGTNKNRKGKKQYYGISTADRLRKQTTNFSPEKLNEINWDSETPSKEFWKELFRVSQNQIIFGGNYFVLPPSRGIAVWDKRQPWDNFSQFELIWTSFDKPAHMFTVSTTSRANDEKKIHPTQKPVILLKQILSWYAQKGWKILDTGFGSGATAIACIDMGFDFVGCEKNISYFLSAMSRIRNHQSQKELFNTSEISTLQSELF